MSTIMESENHSLLSKEALRVLRRAAASPATWRSAQRDPRGFLRKRGISLEEGVSLSLCDLMVPKSGLVIHATELEHPSQDEAERPARPTTVAPSPWEHWWRSTHLGCPIGTYPFKTVRKQQVCVKQGILLSGLEWVPDSEGSPSGHFEYTNKQVICLQSVVRWIEVIECVPRIVLEVAST